MKYLICATMGLGEILLTIACALIVISAVITAIVRKIKGKTGCGGDCSCCSYCSHCKSEIKADDRDAHKI